MFIGLFIDTKLTIFVEILTLYIKENTKMEITKMPQLINAGLYDAAAAHKGCAETSDRRVSVFELELPVEDGGVSFFGGEPNAISHEHIIFAKPGQLRRTRLPFRCLFVHFTAEDTTLRELLFSVPSRLKISDTDAFKKLFTDIIGAYSQPFEGSELYIAARLFTLIDRIYRESEKKKASDNSGNPLITEALKFMDKNYSKNLQLEDIASFLNISPIYFHRLFTSVMGQTPHMYMLRKKLCNAQKLLVTTTLPLSEIAFRTGFGSQSYFGYVFKRELGITPTQFRHSAYRRYPE